MLMIAIIKEVRENSLLVRNRADFQRVVVNTDNTKCFFAGDIIAVTFNGIMTNSLPPQIFSNRIRRIFPRRNCLKR